MVDSAKEVKLLDDCIFCKIVTGAIPSRKVYEDDDILAFHDVSPQAPAHVLIIPKQHVADLLEARALPDDVLARLLRTAADVSVLLGLDATGFRIIANCGKDAQQSVQHLHIHVLGGKPMPAAMV